MQDITDNRLPYAPPNTFTMTPFKDELVEYFNVIAAENAKQEAETIDRVRQEEHSSGLKRTPYYVYYRNQNESSELADEKHNSHSSTENTAPKKSFLQKAKDVIDKIESKDKNQKATKEHLAEHQASISTPLVPMLIDEEPDNAIPALDQATLDSLASDWADEKKVREITERILRTLPVAYGDSSTDIKCEKTINALIQEQKRIKDTLDVAFRQELHVYQKKALPAIPIIRDTCDALDSSQGESRYTLRMLKRARLQATNSVKLISLHRRRNKKREFFGFIDSVKTWQHKTETVCENIINRQYAVAALTLGARLSANGGKYFCRRTPYSTTIESAKDHPFPSAMVRALAVEKSAQVMLPTSPLASPNASARSLTSAPQSPSAKPSMIKKESSEDNRVLSSKNGTVSIPSSPPSPLSTIPLPDMSVPPFGLAFAGDEEDDFDREAGAIAAPPPPPPTALELVLSNYFSNPWDATDRLNSDMSYEEFLNGASSEVQSLTCGMAMLGQYFSLRQLAGKIIGVCVRDDVAILLTQSFNRELLLNSLRGLHALRIRRDDVASFFLELVDPILNERFRAALCDVVGEDAGNTWEEVAKSLVPSELHPCTVSLLTYLSDTLRNLLKLALACNALSEEHSRCSTAFGTEAEGLTVFEGCKFLSGLSSRVIHKCFGAVVSYGSHANLQRGNVADCLHVYRLLHLFVHMCGGVIGDKSAAATNGALRFQLQALYTDHFRANMLDEIMKVMQSESFSPFPVNAGDFQELRVLLEKEGEEEAKERFTKYLQLAPPLSLADDIEDHLKLDVAENPFQSHEFISPAYRPVEALMDRKPFSLFEDGHAIFTFSSYLVCRSMIESVNNAGGLASVSGEMLRTIHGLATVYVDFITTHFVAESETQPLDTDPNTPAHVQSYFASVRSSSQLVASTCPTMISMGFPLCPHAVCMHWKARATQAESMYAVFERATAVASLETVALCHRLCTQAIGGLLDHADMTSVADMNETISGATKFAVRYGFRRMAKSVVSGESFAAAVEKNRWDSNVPLGVQQSGYTSLALTELDAVAQKVKSLFKGMPPKAAVILMQHCVFNIFMGFVEGISRVKKFSESGRAQVLTDALHITRSIKDRYPSTSPKLVEFVLAYARAVMGQWQDVLALVHKQHALYSFRQLIAFGDREGFMKRRELEGVIRGLQHEDRLPLFLIDEL